MTGVRVKDGESFENAMKRFKKQCEKAGILSEIRKREHEEDAQGLLSLGSPTPWASRSSSTRT